MSTVTIEQLHKFHDEISKGRITRELLQAFLENPSGFVKVGQFPSLTLAANLIPTGWTLIEDVVPSTKNGRDFITFLEKGESYINGEVMRQRAKKHTANLGLVDAKRDLEHQDNIPVGLRGKYLVYSGTVLRDSDGNLDVPCLDWGGDRWVLLFRWLGDDFYVFDRLARGK